MNRQRAFKNDLNIGRIGEESLLKILKESYDNKRIQYFENVTDNIAYRNSDIDFITVSNDGEKITYEVKTDTYGTYTRNMSYEITSNNFAGCLARSNADYLYYVFVDKDSLIIKESYIIMMMELRRWLGEHYEYIVKDHKKLSLFYSKDIGVLQFLINIDELKKDNIAKKII